MSAPIEKKEPSKIFESLKLALYLDKNKNIFWDKIDKFKK